MDSKDFLESILVGDQDESQHNFNNIMAEKISDALEVRKVELASGIMDEASDIDKLGKKYAKAEKDEAEKQDTYSKKYPGGNKQKEAAKAAFMKRFANEEVEQIVEISRETLKSYVKAANKQKTDITSKPQYQSKPGVGTHIDPRSGYTEKNRVPGKPMSRADSKTWNKRDVGQDIAKQKLNRTSQQVKVKATGEPTLSAKRQASFKFEEVEQVDEVTDTGTSDIQKDLAVHRTNLQKMNMASTEKSKVMTALKTHMQGRRLNMNQSTALLGYLGKAGGLGDVNASVRNKVLKQQSAKKDEV